MFKACNFQKLHQQEIHVVVPGGEILKCDPEIGKTAIQPEPAQTADLSISGSSLISSLCIYIHTFRRKSRPCSG